MSHYQWEWERKAQHGRSKREKECYRQDTRERTDSVWEITMGEREWVRERERETSGMKMGWDWRAYSISRCVQVGLFQISVATRALALNVDGEAVLAVYARTLVRQQGSCVCVCLYTILLWRTRRQAFPPTPSTTCHSVTAFREVSGLSLATARESPRVCVCVLSVDAIVERPECQVH